MSPPRKQLLGGLTYTQKEKAMTKAQEEYIANHRDTSEPEPGTENDTKRTWGGGNK